MVNGITGNSSYPSMYATARTTAQAAGRYSNDVENLVKYLNGQPMTPQGEESLTSAALSSLPFCGVIGSFSAYNALKANKFNIMRTINTINTASPIKARGQFMEAATNGIKEFFAPTAVTNDAGRWKIFKLLDKVPGYKALRQSRFGQLMGKSKAGGFAVLGGALELLTQVIPAFQQGGAEAGFKQIGKSSLKVAGDVGGFVVGDLIGKGIGAAIGTLICPGIGTTIGGYIGGFVGGMVGSAAAGKAVRAVTGPTEMEKIQQEQISQVAQQIDADPNSKLQLAQQALQQAEAVLQQDPTNADALAAKAAAENTINELAQSGATQTQQSSQAQNPAQAPAQAQYAQAPVGAIPVIPGFNSFGVDMNAYRQGMQHTSAIMTPGLNTNNLFNNQNFFNPMLNRSAIA